jgi:hypothetical protein
MADKEKQGWPGPTSPPTDGSPEDEAQAWPGPTAPPRDEGDGEDGGDDPPGDDAA